MGVLVHWGAADVCSLLSVSLPACLCSGVIGSLLTPAHLCHWWSGLCRALNICRRVRFSAQFWARSQYFCTGKGLCVCARVVQDDPRQGRAREARALAGPVEGRGGVGLWGRACLRLHSGRWEVAAIPHSSVLRPRRVGSQTAPRLVLDLLSCSALLMGQASRAVGSGGRWESGWVVSSSPRRVWAPPYGTEGQTGVRLQWAAAHSPHWSSSLSRIEPGANLFPFSLHECGFIPSQEALSGD